LASALLQSGELTMPLHTERLTSESSDEAIQEAISKSIEQCMQEGGRDQEQCVAIAHSTARRATKGNLGRRPARLIREGMGE